MDGRQPIDLLRLGVACMEVSTYGIFDDLRYLRLGLSLMSEVGWLGRLGF